VGQLLFGAVAVLDGSRTSVFVIRSAARSEYRDVQEPSQLSAVDHVARIDFDRPAMTKNSRNRSTAIDAECWPAVATVPSGPVAAASAVIADRLLRRAVVSLPLRLVYPDGTVIGAGDATAPALVIHRPDRLARRMGRYGLIGFGDQTMTYSSALFRRLPASWPDLAEAQQHKIDRVLDAAGVGPGTRLLEIGSGWGELCIRAAARGADVRSVALSERQLWLARQRIAAAGQSDRVRIDLRDYRDVGGNYDAVISVEMIEAIGFHAWPDYFRTLERLLRPNGRLAIQAITMPHDRMLATRNTHTWIQKYIFPGGLIPSAKAVLEVTQRQTGLRPVDTLSLRQHYAETLRLWRERFLQRRKTLAHIGFDEVFARMWELYLAYAEAGFRSGYLDVYQWTFASEALP
jgi:cyclopropane fatty-acyl-phospholipid synthase-like methyltransferase